MRLKTADGEIDEQKALKLFDYAYHNGVNYLTPRCLIPTARTKLLLGRLKRYPRNSFYLATKLTLRLFESRKEVEELIDKQLETLQTDYIDMYLLHAMNKERLQKVKEWEIIPCLKSGRPQGKLGT